ILCSNPNKDFEILDGISVEDNLKSLKQQITAAPSSSTYSTSNVDNNIYDNSYNIYFDQTAVEIAKLFANSISQVMQEQGQEADINWLASKLNTISNKESSWKVNNYQENELNIELSSSSYNGLKVCSVFQSNDFVKQSTDQHCDDSIKSLQFLAKWINDISEIAEKNTQCLLLDEIFREVIAFFKKSKLAKLNEENISDKELESDTIRNNEND
ncbi:11917_t:CDS:2, partial [Racocetra persica]